MAKRGFADLPWSVKSCRGCEVGKENVRRLTGVAGSSRIVPDWFFPGVWV